MIFLSHFAIPKNSVAMVPDNRPIRYYPISAREMTVWFYPGPGCLYPSPDLHNTKAIYSWSLWCRLWFSIWLPGTQSVAAPVADFHSLLKSWRERMMMGLIMRKSYSLRVSVNTRSVGIRGGKTIQRDRMIDGDGPKYRPHGPLHSVELAQITRQAGRESAQACVFITIKRSPPNWITTQDKYRTWSPCRKRNQLSSTKWKQWRKLNPGTRTKAQYTLDL
jgi:hypothetical protein